MCMFIKFSLILFLCDIIPLICDFQAHIVISFCFTINPLDSGDGDILAWKKLAGSA